MNENKLKRLFPNASKSFIQGNLDKGKPAELEQGDKNESLGANISQERDSNTGFIIVTDVRKRLLDDDNLCEKYHIDALRYEKVIGGDSRKFYRIFTSQRKCEKEEEPHTLIEIFEKI